MARSRPALTFHGVDGAAMRLIHTSDWHLGRSLHGESLLEHQAAFLDWLLGQAVSHEVDAVVVAGDVYDRAVPPTDAVTLLDATLLAFAREHIPMVITSGNHDSPIRLGFGAGLSEAAGIHLRTSVADIARPVIISDEHGQVGIYGVPYLLPDAVMADLGAERSHTSVLAAAAARIRADAAARNLPVRRIHQQGTARPGTAPGPAGGRRGCSVRRGGRLMRRHGAGLMRRHGAGLMRRHGVA